MNTRHLIVGAAIAGAVSVGVPAVAHAAPVVPAQAVLAAHEFPFGSTGYETNQSVEKAPTKPSGTTPCDLKEYEAEKTLTGARSADAQVDRGETTLAASILDRPIINTIRDLRRDCGSRFVREGRPLAVPADLTRYKADVFTFAEGQLLDATVEVRGVTVSVMAVNEKNPADFDGFWQTLRAQVAKVERQP
ncbi:putative protein OS=Tsukamurella paurometabola (strain ATCC 8368 / DSM / CCUG 35730 /CIP 100753 / JCM 10117 / KCTC 9821 / NBRC 16120 / NCIMB 702349/ NCTC 13040) OX=521096 GN=Tpau_1768 PE=4 SV=1 [Tsukamurella paurometabola]|uniref:Uncharacterized protein n=1 Tax=Tsukamurella paurometabola (strain ATCC 8368 / DSM 20162 / CCUG 35730 / CIP 100753 / JCM 10117 / KCTC 9821 / NBRC 16120 / NCIMB 702349 / NCTC 13040) TaxID=521096 RepID=D5UMA6_TSUPD|nr:hypothetical protein [Tsukamurella paurometabola]ADG78386.1 hypothetical protein Tpau_1768 [Tsukamurella paurometabola DSM 20162]SUP31441.1 Uncharacterised protein [Tsukamurella paurometabola]